MKKLLTFTIACLPAAAFAHGGHSHFDPHTLIHYLGTPEHAVPIFTIVAVLTWAWYRRRRKAEA